MYNISLMSTVWFDSDVVRVTPTCYSIAYPVLHAAWVEHKLSNKHRRSIQEIKSLRDAKQVMSKTVTKLCETCQLTKKWCL